jgi:DNA primase
MIDGLEPKYYNPAGPGFRRRKRDLFWGLQRFTGPVEDVVLTEGVFDAVWFPNRLSIMGKNITPQQINILNQIGPRRLTIALDGEARREAADIAYRISQSFSGRIYIAEYPRDSDPDSFRFDNGPVEQARRVA